MKVNRSTLPDLYKADLNTIKYHPNQRPQKIGGRFSLNLNNQKKAAIQMGKNKKQQSTNITLSRRSSFQDSRTQSIHITAQKAWQQPKSHQFTQSQMNNYQSQNSKIKAQRSITLLQSKMSQLYSETGFVHSHLKKLRINKNDHVGLLCQSRMNNMTIALQEADSLKNRLDNVQLLKQTANQQLTQTKQSVYQLNQQLNMFNQSYLAQLQNLSKDFTSRFKHLHKIAHNLRRQTNQQIKINKNQAQKLYQQIKDCNSIYQIIQERSNILREDCIEVQRILSTNSKTYLSQNLERSSNKLRTIDICFSKNRRSQTSHQQRKSKVIQHIFDEQDIQVRAQTTHKNRVNNIEKQQNNKSEYKQQDDFKQFKQEDPISGQLLAQDQMEALNQKQAQNQMQAADSLQAYNLKTKQKTYNHKMKKIKHQMKTQNKKIQISKYFRNQYKSKQGLN